MTALVQFRLTRVAHPLETHAEGVAFLSVSVVSHRVGFVSDHGDEPSPTEAHLAGPTRIVTPEVAGSRPARSIVRNRY